ncbi:DNA sulfur modification protein DndE [Herbaspirillum rubrisubalbicans]|uniref:DNA sulfur modification protein DndE n=1 Tax=Herbaspirillum rubrisubalbicans TaxID=80842 RepID=UPI0020A0F521|nr:DNA sulfur modification protein DndE [Herbaspirillum rubrisubalbicans]MCP1575355.1 DNA sulfur modification protein DndE [Herbaspirillum rubrisubalbicans]
MIVDRIRLTAAAKNQLISLKRKTGIEHYNVLCRHAFCLSLKNPSIPPKENFNFSGGIDIDWRTFSGGQEILYLNLLLLRLHIDELPGDETNFRYMLHLHIHRGLAYLTSKKEEDLLKALALEICEVLENAA